MRAKELKRKTLGSAGFPIHAVRGTQDLLDLANRELREGKVVVAVLDVSGREGGPLLNLVYL